MTKPELISFKLCPYVQRSVITLKEKGIDFDITYIDLKNPPAWFTEISPLGKVPCLKVGQDTLFESAVINEYLDEINPPSLHPLDPLKKAHNRAWIEFGSTMLVNQYMVSMSDNKSVVEENIQEIKDKLTRLEDQVSEPFFNGESFSLIDTSFAPLFMRLNLLENWGGVMFYENCPKVEQWGEDLLQIEAVIHSVVPEFRDLLKNYIQQSDSYFATQLMT
jgi:glutathione S-transferase